MQNAAWITAVMLAMPTAAFASDGPEGMIPYPDWIIFVLAWW